MQAYVTVFKLMLLHTHFCNYMQAHGPACKLMLLHASMQAHGSACILHTFWNILTHSAYCLEHARTFWIFFIHSGTFWNILHTFWDILEHFAYILEHSGCCRRLNFNLMTHLQTDIRTCWAASSQLKIFKKCLSLYFAYMKYFSFKHFCKTKQYLVMQKCCFPLT